jgi:signal transduction histidine kinase
LNGTISSPILVSKATNATNLTNATNENPSAKNQNAMGKSFWTNPFFYSGIVLLIIVLTIFISLLDRSLKEMRNRAVQVADEERISMALSISTYLFDQQRVTNVTVNHSLARVLRDILNSTESLEKTSKELNRTVKDIPSNREMLKEIKNIKARIFQRSWL